ncbi:hypothetical protein [Saccharopolyspora shandongensis]|uniref:hypothetical protein n=1 Tax=Saccharopolyspora shandongensis TaxID=418495 RepID=UPI0034115FC9
MHVDSLCSQPAGPISPGVIKKVGEWTLERLPEATKRALDDDSVPSAFLAEIDSVVLTDLPDVVDLTQVEAQRLLVDLGFCGSAVARVATESGHDVAHLLGTLGVGAHRRTFRDYYADLATRSGVGHPPRQTFVSTITWNAPTIEVRVDDTVAATLPSVFDDQRTRTWTGTSDEASLWLLFKKCAGLGAVANVALAPVVFGDLPVDSPDAPGRLAVATAAMEEMQDQMRIFSMAGNRAGGMSADVFIYGIRQFGVPWDDGAEAPSGPHEAEWIKRDVMLGLRSPNYLADVRRRYPMLLEPDVHAIEKAIGQPSLAEKLREAWRSDLRGEVDAATKARLAATTLAARSLWRATGRCSSAHLGLARKFLFSHLRKQARTSTSPTAVSNDSGITGMTEQDVVRLAEQRMRGVFDDILRHVDPKSLVAAEAELGRRPSPACALVVPGIDAGRVGDLPNRRCGDRTSESGRFALDPSVPPPRVRGPGEDRCGLDGEDVVPAAAGE